jgi:hypothetical protein
MPAPIQFHEDRQGPRVAVSVVVPLCNEQESVV